jgi:uncharacterized membrane protein HdeD (DUF308 family)
MVDASLPPRELANEEGTVEREPTSPSGEPTLVNDGATTIVTEYLIREVHVPEPEARARAGALVGLLGTRRATATLGENWWLFLLRGLLAVVFGVLALVQPIAALTALVFVFGVWAIIDGVNALALAIGGWRSWQLVLAGLIGVAVGIFTFVQPSITAVGLFAVVAAWAVARGILEIVVAIELRRQIRGEGWLILAGVASIVFGVLMILLPVAGLLAIAWIIGVYALVFGVLYCALAFRLRRVHEAERHPTARPTPMPLPT